MPLAEVVATSTEVGRTRSRTKKSALLAALLRRLDAHELPIGVAYLMGELPQGKIGVGWALLRDLDAGMPASTASLGLRAVDDAFNRVRGIAGAGSNARRRDALGALFAQATSEERAFLERLLIGELRQGALEGAMLDAIGEAFAIDRGRIRRAAMLAGSIPAVAVAVQERGAAGLDAFALRHFAPVLPMLASPAEDAETALDAFGEAAFEAKVDGARIQVHKDGDTVRLYSRSLHDVTARAPEIVGAVRALPAKTLILDGEAIALRADGSPHPFQTTMRRFGRTKNVRSLQAALPLSGVFFDCLELDGEILIDGPTRRRIEALDQAVSAPATSAAQLVSRVITADPEEVEALWHRTLALGHEGLMAKALDSPYEAGRRGQSWLKLKQVHTLDLVVLAVEWGSGRRRGWLSNLHLGARAPQAGSFVMLGKTFKGMTDEMLTWQTEKLLALEVGREGHVVHVRPELVVEVAFNDVQESSHYPSSVALRFARVKRYRTDKRAAEADTIDAVRALLPTTGLPTTGLPTTGLPTTGLPTTGLPTTGLPTTGPTTRSTREQRGDDQ
jgi:DNA ligase-1